MAAQVISPAHHVEAFMHEVIPVPETVLVEELWLAVVRVPAAVPDPASQEKILPRHKERISPWATCEFGPNLLAELVRRALVGIDAQHPVVRHQIQRAVAELPKAFEITLIEPVRVLFTDLLGPVVAVGIKDYDLVCPLDALESIANLRFLVEGEDVSRELRHGPPGWAARAPVPG